jgi:hypothetical protein
MLPARRRHRLVLLIVALGIAVLLGACASSSSRAAALPAPGDGVSIADQLYTDIKPLPGEQIAIGNVRNADRDTHRYLADRLQAAVDANPEWFSHSSEGEPQSGFRLVFQDGSTMTWVPRASTVGPSALLDHVEITRPH